MYKYVMCVKRTVTQTHRYTLTHTQKEKRTTVEIRMIDEDV